tara:strand:- start:8169 stop:12878 length:4710 start_codon:yes stop_codon:yes gene_type:complete
MVDYNDILNSNLFEDDDLVKTLPLPGVRRTDEGVLDLNLAPESIPGIDDPLGDAGEYIMREGSEKDFSFYPKHDLAKKIYKYGSVITDAIGVDAPDLIEKYGLNDVSITMAALRKAGQLFMGAGPGETLRSMEMEQDISPFQLLELGLIGLDAAGASAATKLLYKKAMSGMNKYSANSPAKNYEILQENPEIWKEISLLDEGTPIEELSEAAKNKLGVGAGVTPKIRSITDDIDEVPAKEINDDLEININEIDETDVFRPIEDVDEIAESVKTNLKDKKSFQGVSPKDIIGRGSEEPADPFLTPELPIEEEIIETLKITPSIETIKQVNPEVITAFAKIINSSNPVKIKKLRDSLTPEQFSSLLDEAEKLIITNSPPAVGPGKKIREANVGSGKYDRTRAGIDPKNRTAKQRENNAKRTAIVDHLQPIYDAAKNDEGTAFLSPQWKFQELKKIADKNPKLFPDGLTSTKMNELLYSGDIKYPFEKIKNPNLAANFQKDVSTLTGEAPGGYNAQFARSAGEDLKNVDEYEDFLSSQGIDVDMAKSFPEDASRFKLMEQRRVELQDFIKNDQAIQKKLRSQDFNYDKNKNFMPIVVQKAHPDRSIKPKDASFEFGGADTANVKLLGKTVNQDVQPDLERALVTFIKDKDVEGSQRIIEMLDEFFIATKLNDALPGFPNLKTDDYEWLIQNKIIERPQYDNYDEIIFGNLKQPDQLRIIDGEIEARKYVQKRKQHEGSEPFYKSLAAGGMVEDDMFEEQVSVDQGTPTIDMAQESIFDDEASYETANLILPLFKLFGKPPGNTTSAVPIPKPELDAVSNLKPKADGSLRPKQQNLKNIQETEESIFDPTPDTPVNIADPALQVKADVFFTPYTNQPSTSVFYSDIERALSRKDTPAQFNNKEELNDFFNKNSIKSSEKTDYRIESILKLFPEDQPIRTSDIISQVRQAPIAGMRIHGTGFNSELVNPQGAVRAGHDHYYEPGSIPGSYRERVLMIPKKNLPGDSGKLPENMGGEGPAAQNHNFNQGDDNYTIGWSRLTDRVGYIPPKISGPKTSAGSISKLERDIESLESSQRGLMAEAQSKLQREAVRKGINDEISIYSVDDILKYEDTLNEISPGFVNQFDEQVTLINTKRSELQKATAPNVDGYVKVTFADEIQSDLLQAAALRKQYLGQTMKKLIAEGKTSSSLSEYADVNKKLLQFYEENSSVFRPQTKTQAEVDVLGLQLKKVDEEVDDIINKYVTTREISDKDIKKLSVMLEKNMNDMLETISTVDSSTMDKLFPDIPLKNRNEWSDAIIKADLYEAAYRKFVLKDPDAAGYYAVSPSDIVKKRYQFRGGADTSAVDRAAEKQRQMDIFMRNGEVAGSNLKGIGMDEFYGGPNVKSAERHYVIDKSKPIKDTLKDDFGNPLIDPRTKKPYTTVTGYQRVKDFKASEDINDAQNYVDVNNRGTDSKFEVASEQPHYKGELEKILQKQAKENNSEFLTMPVQLKTSRKNVYIVTDQNGNMVATLSNGDKATELKRTNPNYNITVRSTPDEKDMSPVFAIKITKEMLEPYVTHKAMGGLVEDIDIFEV